LSAAAARAYVSDATTAGSADDAGGDTGSAGAATGDGEDEGGAVETPPGRPCPLCGRSMARRHCKYVCPEHGVVYDCSDTFW